MAADLAVSLDGGAAFQQVHAFEHGVLSKFILNGEGNALQPALFFFGKLPGLLFLLHRLIIREHVQLLGLILRDFCLRDQIAGRDVYTADQHVLVNHMIIYVQDSVHDGMGGAGIARDVPGAVGGLGDFAPIGVQHHRPIVFFAAIALQAFAVVPNIQHNLLRDHISETNRLLSPTFDALSSYDIKIRVQDVFYYIEQTVSIGTKQVMMDFYKDGSGIAFGKVAENAGKVEFGWPLLLSEALGVDQGGTGAETASAACTKLGAVKKSGDTMTGNLAISGYLYPSLYLLPTYNSTTNRTVFEGSYVGASSFSSWEDGTGNNRRMLEVRNAAYQASLDFAVLLRTCSGGTWASYRLFHAGMATPIPLANGGTGASSAKAALSNLGIFYSASLPSSGTDGQICLVPV